MGIQTRWARITGDNAGPGYAKRIAELAATGEHMHGEADLCAALVQPPARILDAGCGTGRVALRLTELGYECEGTDFDPSMIAVAAESSNDIDWHIGDLAEFESEQPFDVVLCAGNVIPLLGEGMLATTARNVRELLGGDGLFVSGFGIDAAHLPAGCDITPLADFDAACAAAEMSLVERFSTWEGAPYSADTGYAVSIHRAN